MAFDMFAAVLRSVEPTARTAWSGRTLPDLSRVAFEHPAEGFTPPVRVGGPPAAQPAADPGAGAPPTGDDAQRAFETHLGDAIRHVRERSSATGGAAGPSGGTPP